MRAVKASTARDIMVFMADSTDHITGKTGLALTITASKAGAAFASISPTVTERGSGFYNLALTGTHLDTVGDFALHITGAAADPSDIIFEVVAYDPQDAAALGLSRVDAAISSRSTLAAGALMGLADDAITSAKIAAGAITSSEAPALANLDAAVSTRAPESGGTLATLLARIVGTLATGTHNPQSGDAFARLGAPAGASIAADIATRAPEAAGNLAAVKAKTDNLPASPAAVGSAMTLAAGAVTAAAIAAGAIGATQAPNLDAAVSTRAIENGGRIEDIHLDVGDIHNDVGTIDSRTQAIKTKTDALPIDPADQSLLEAAIATRAATGDAMALTNAAVDLILDEVVEGTLSLRAVLRILLAGIAGKASGAPTGPIHYRDQADSKDRITGTIDADGNRTAVTVDGA